MYNLHMCRAKTFDGVWVIGYVVFPSDPLPGLEAIIVPAECNMFEGEAEHKLGFDDWYRVDKDTVCRFTGFKATNGDENYGGNFQYLTCCDEVQVVGNVFDDPWPVSKSRVF